jgi:hypothetical protein
LETEIKPGPVPAGPHQATGIGNGQANLQEVFHARPFDVEDMIQGRLEEKNYPVKCEEGLWPATFCLED